MTFAMKPDSNTQDVWPRNQAHLIKHRMTFGQKKSPMTVTVWLKSDDTLTMFPRQDMDRRGLDIAFARHADSCYGAESIMWRLEPNFRGFGDVVILYYWREGRQEPQKQSGE